MISMDAFSDELVKIASTKISGLSQVVGGAKTLGGFAKANPQALKYLAAVGAGGAALKGGERVYENQRMAEAMRERMAAARGA